MPFAKITTGVKLEAKKEEEVCKEVEKAIADIIGKPMRYVAVAYIHATCMRFSGGSDHSAVLEVSSIGGLNSTTNNKLADALTKICEKHMGVAGDRIYVTFTDFSAGNFANSGRTFG